jgi:hypothetical protein
MRILLLSTYPAVNPAHGGQHRLREICRALQSAGHSVDCRGVLGSASYPQTPGYVQFPGTETLSAYLPKPMLMEDWAIGKYAADPKGGFPKLSKLCAERYDAIYCEQPWLFEFAYRHCSQRKRRPIFIYGSQNVEHRLKFEIAEQYLNSALAEEYSALVRETECFAATHSDLNVVVSEPDKEWIESVSSTPTVLAANGVADRRATLRDVQRSNEITGCRKFALYCASSHPPNIQGFYDMFGKGVGCLAPEQRLVVVGGAGASIAADPRFSRVSGLARKFVAAGEVSESQLSGLLATAHVILLPITRGGGTNLKSAEALWSGRHVVGTTISLRGFEDFRSARGLAVADDPPAFQKAILSAMSAPPLQLEAAERKARARVLWPATLKELTEALGEFEMVS